MKIKSNLLFDSAPAMVTVDEITQQIRNVLTQSPILKRFYLRGELQGFKRHTSGHIYFTLLGQEARIAGVLFRSDAVGVAEWACDGAEVCVEGRIDVYPARGSYQLYATRMMPLGEGAQAKAKQELMKKLQHEGIFEPSRKRPFPLYPERVAVITSPTGAAIQDVLAVARARFASAQIVLIPTLVQGIQAPEEIVKAFAHCLGRTGISAVMLVRGGGGREDLNPFDDERVVRAVSTCPLPVITGVGHQIDSTLVDMVADASAPTPSAAAERLFPDHKVLIHRLETSRRSLVLATEKIMNKSEAVLEQKFERLLQRQERYQSEEETKLILLRQVLLTGITQKIQESQSLLREYASSLQALSPLAVMGRGYLLCRDTKGRILKGAHQLGVGKTVCLSFVDGEATATIEDIRLGTKRGELCCQKQ